MTIEFWDLDRHRSSYIKENKKKINRIKKWLLLLFFERRISLFRFLFSSLNNNNNT